MLTGGDAGVMSVAYSTASGARQLILLSPSLRVLWFAYADPEVTCLDGGLALTLPNWLPFQLAYEEGGERLRVDLRPAHDVLEAAFAKQPGNSLADATNLERMAESTASVLRGFDNDAMKALLIDAIDLEQRERAWASPPDYASALRFLSKTPRGRAIAQDVEKRLVSRAPFVMRDLHLLESHAGASSPRVFWRADGPCVAWAGAARCTDPTTGRTFST